MFQSHIYLCSVVYISCLNRDARNVSLTIIDGKVPVVTGASSGVGTATAREHLAHGAYVVLATRRRGSQSIGCPSGAQTFLVISSQYGQNVIPPVVDTPQREKGGTDTLCQPRVQNRPPSITGPDINARRSSRAGGP